VHASLAGKKERERFSKKIVKVKSTLSVLIKKYGEVNSFLPSDSPYHMQGAITMDDLLSGSFPWTDARAALHLQGKSTHTCRIMRAPPHHH